MFGLIHTDSLNNKKNQQTSSRSGNLFFNIENGFLNGTGREHDSKLDNIIRRLLWGKGKAFFIQLLLLSIRLFSLNS